MSFTMNCGCVCHYNTVDPGYCMQCVANHQQISPNFTVNTNVDYNSSIYSTLNEIRSILTDIKKLLEKKSNGRGTKSRKVNRPKT